MRNNKIVLQIWFIMLKKGKILSLYTRLWRGMNTAISSRFTLYLIIITIVVIFYTILIIAGKSQS